MMKAVVYERFGPPEVLEIKNIETPTPRANEILVKVVATTVSAADSRLRSQHVPRGYGLLMRLLFGFKRPRKPILGTEISGLVTSIGDGVRQFKVGDRVFAATGMALGGYAEYVAISESAAVARVPETLSLDKAAALAFGGTTALDFLRRASIQPGERVLVNGAAGCVGSAAVQLAKHLGANVTGVCSAANVDLVKSFGADQVIDYVREDFAQCGQRWDVILDAVGNAGYPRSKTCLNAGGRLLLVVADLPAQLLSVWQSLRGPYKVYAGPIAERPEDLKYLADLAAAKKFTPYIDRRYALEQIVEAHRYVDSGRKRGSVLVTIA